MADQNNDRGKKGAMAFGYPDVEEYVNRDRGMFSTADREHLIGLKDYSQPQARSNAKRRVRERVGHTFRDFGLLWAIDPSDRAKVFDSISTEQLHDNLAVLVEFVYLGLKKDSSRLEQIIHSGIYNSEDPDIHEVKDDIQSERNAEANQPGVKEIDVQVSIDVDVSYGPDIDGIERLFREEGADALTEKQIGKLVRHGRIDHSDLEALKRNSG